MDFEAILAGRDPAQTPEWLAPLRDALVESPDPERAVRLAGDLLAVVPPGDLERAAAARPEKLARVMGALCGIAPFFKTYFVRHSDWLLRLLDEDLALPRAEADLALAIEDALDGVPLDAAGEALRTVKYYELARLTVRDACEAWVPLAESAITLEEISRLADALLDRGLRVAQAQVEAELGPPRWATAAGEEVELAFWVLGLGKLGSDELNYSSDVDLVYIYQSAPPDLVVRDGQLAPTAWFTRLAQTFGALVTPVTAEGFLYRVDLELRPDDAQGCPVISEGALFGYFETRADLWEKAAYMKARPVAGDLAQGWRSIRALAPMIYLSGIDYRGVAAIRSLKAKVESAKGERGGGFNVKIDSGGIRDVEYVAQALQLLHGARIPQVRDRSTRRSLRHLCEIGLLPVDRAEALEAGYLFLRRVENRLQMEAERQTHVLSNDDAARTRIARAVGYRGEAALAEFDATLAEHRRRISEVAGASIAQGAVDHILELFVRHVPQLVMSPASEPLVKAVADGFARHIDASPDPESALNNLDRFIEGIGSRRFYYELLIDRPEIVARLAALFASSRFLSGYFASHPRLIEPVFRDPNTLLLSRDGLQADLAGLSEPDDDRVDPTEYRLDALRHFHHRQVINVGLLDISEEVARGEVEGALTAIAEVCLDGALELARRMLAASRPPPEAAQSGAFLVVGMGKLSSGELSYGSDLDVIFLYDTVEEGGAGLLEAQEYFVRLTQRLISNLQTPTAAGFCYEIDARLRPSGNQGTLVTSLAAFHRYHEQQSAVWERQTLLRARPVVGDAGLGHRFDEERRRILSRPPPDDLAQEIHRIRGRMEVEIAKETTARRDFKTGRGGLLDVECVVQYLQLRHVGRHPELLDVARTEETIEKLRTLSLLEESHAETLARGWEFLQRLGNRMRIVENRSISDLQLERGHLDGLARRMGYSPGGREGAEGRELLRDYGHHTEAIREVYLAILEPDGGGS